MRRFEHGGDIYAHEGVIDFSANINPLGMPRDVRDLLQARVDCFEAYPDPHCSELRQLLAQANGVGEEQLVCAAGATELFGRIAHAMAPRTALVVDPCYLGYEQALEQFGIRVRHHALREEDDFALTHDVLDAMTADTSLVFIANPNNPTGLTVPEELLQAILERAGHIGARVVLDESFIEFTDAKSMMGRIGEYPQLFIVRSFTKIYAMAGLRLGYGVCSDEGFVRELERLAQPWSISTPAQLAGCAALRQYGFVEKSRSYVREARAQLTDALRNLGLRCIESDANYIMFKCEQELYAPLLERGLLIRRCENYAGLDGSWYRIAVRTHEENNVLIDALGEVLS